MEKRTLLLLVLILGLAILADNLFDNRGESVTGNALSIRSSNRLSLRSTYCSDPCKQGVESLGLVYGGLSKDGLDVYVHPNNPAMAVYIKPCPFKSYNRCREICTVWTTPCVDCSPRQYDGSFLCDTHFSFSGA